MEDYTLFIVVTIAWMIGTIMLYEKRFMVLIGYIGASILLASFVGYRNLKCDSNLTGIFAPWIIFLTLTYMLESGYLLTVFENTFGNLWLYLGKAEKPLQESMIKEALKNKIPIQGLSVISDSILSKVNLRNFKTYLSEWGSLGLTLDKDQVEGILRTKEIVSKFVWFLLTGVFVISIINMNVSSMNMRCGVEKGDVQVWTREEEQEESKLMSVFD
jgi:hypothetical protein